MQLGAWAAGKIACEQSEPPVYVGRHHLHPSASMPSNEPGSDEPVDQEMGAAVASLAGLLPGRR